MQSGLNAPAILDALGDPVRRTIFQRLRRAEQHVTALAQGLSVTRSAVSRHLAVLAGAGLVEARQEGRRRIYAVRAGGLEPLRAWIELTPASRGARRGGNSTGPRPPPWPDH